MISPNPSELADPGGSGRHAPNAPTPPCIEFRDVSYARDGQLIIDRLSFRSTERRIGVVGLNGSGKTTLARLVCGLIKPTGGEVLINGSDVAKDRRAALGLVGIVFQNPDHQIIFPTVQEELSFGLTQAGLTQQDAADRALEVLGEFGRRDWAGRAVQALSQGQRHLVCIMAVMAMGPSLIVLDEPFSGPDVPTVRQLHRQLNKLRVSQLLITHDLQYLNEFGRIIWLDRGRIRRDGPPEAVLREFSAEIDKLSELDALSGFTDQHPVPQAAPDA